MFLVDEANLDDNLAYLGKKTNEFNSEEANKSQAPWIFVLSKGSLTVPFNKFIDDIEMFEVEFKKYHGTDGLRRNETRMLDNFKEILINKFG